MKCIYCNKETDLSISDIIPAALTGAKLTKRFVCREHNGFTNDHYEKKLIGQLAMFRNLIGLTERDGDPVRYSAKIEIDGYTVESKTVSDIASIVNPKSPFRATDENGNTVLIGDIERLKQIKDAGKNEIQAFNMANVEVSRVDDLRELLISREVLHAIAKIGYEWRCYHHEIESFDPTNYHEIVDYILSPESEEPFVSLVISQQAYTIMDSHMRTGSNMVFEYDDIDGFTYVVFGLFGVLMYKIRICRHGKAMLDSVNFNQAFFYHVDKSTEVIEFGTVGARTFSSEAPPQGLHRLYKDIVHRFSKLGERDLSKAYIANSVARIKPLLPRYKQGRLTIPDLLDFESKDRVIPIYILELLLRHKEEYNPDDTFRNNMVRILKTDDRYVFTNKLRTETINRYLKMDQAGEFCEMLEKAISFFETVCR